MKCSAPPFVAGVIALGLFAACSGSTPAARSSMPLASGAPPRAAPPPNTVSPPPPPPPKAWSTFRDLVMTPDQCKAPPRATISRAEALADASVVERIVRRGWAGFETMTRTGADFDAVFAALARWI